MINISILLFLTIFEKIAIQSVCMKLLSIFSFYDSYKLSLSFKFLFVCVPNIINKYLYKNSETFDILIIMFYCHFIIERSYFEYSETFDQFIMIKVFILKK